MVLIVTNRSDLTSDYIVKEIRQRGLDFIRLNTEEFPTNIIGSIEFKKREILNVLYFKDRERLADFSKITSVYYRRPVSPVPDMRIINEDVRNFCVKECYDFLRGVWYSIDAFWISPPENIRIAEHKIYQLKVAKKLNFLLPCTLITNNPDDVLQFYKNSHNGIIIKPLYSGYIESKDDPKVIYTTIVEKKDLLNLIDIELVPSIYQANINKLFDLRVTVVGTKVFSVKIEIKDKSETIPDWRYCEIDSLKHSIYQLPENLKRKCIRLVRELGLEFGAIDFAIDQMGNHYFLEINPNGQWAWLEELLNLPISRTIVDHLLNNSI